MNERELLYLSLLLRNLICWTYPTDAGLTTGDAVGGRNAFLGVEQYDISYDGETPDAEILPIRLAKSTYFGSVSDITQEDRLPLSFLKITFSIVST